jgi:REP element-mobilizing transposase RayT
LKFTVIRFETSRVRSIAAAFAAAMTEHSYTCYACAIMPDHVHLVVRKHRHRAEAMIEQLQSASRALLSESRLIPQEHPCWTSGGWRGFLDTPVAVRATIRYVENNPPKSGLPPQVWPFVVRYDGWPYRGSGKRPR